WRDEAAEHDLATLMEVVIAARKLRAEQNVPPSQRVSIRVAAGAQATREVLTANEESVLLLARGSDIELEDEANERPAMAELVRCFGETVAVWIAWKASRQELEAQHARLEKELRGLREEEERLAQKLGNEQFMTKAPEHVKAQVRQRYEESQAQTEALSAQLCDLARSLDNNSA
ncbi:MAG: hypothetical protein JXA57_02240, partial [Armatimonadetes bacterium]|nr:hypothetical protein [Armatimonadota bacterium]